jgi:hypothetical protein
MSQPSALERIRSYMSACTDYGLRALPYIAAGTAIGVAALATLAMSRSFEREMNHLRTEIRYASRNDGGRRYPPADCVG